MTVVEPVFGGLVFRTTGVSFNCDLTRAGGRLIPLGVLAEVRAGQWYGLGVRGRAALAPDELALIGTLARSLFSAPFKVLEREHERVWNSPDPLAAFSALPSVGSSLVFDPVETIEEPLTRPLATGGDDAMQVHLYERLSVMLVATYSDRVERLLQPRRINVGEVVELRAA